MRLLDEIIGKEILDENASIIGKVKDIEIDTSSKKLESIIIVKEGSKKGFRNTKTEEKIPFEYVSKIGDKILVKKDDNNLTNLFEEFVNNI